MKLPPHKPRIRNIFRSRSTKRPSGYTPYPNSPCNAKLEAQPTHTNMSNISVLLVDDHNIVRQGLKALLTAEGDITIAAEAQTGREAVQIAGRIHPEVVV